jgi:hypothetical protein
MVSYVECNTFIERIVPTGFKEHTCHVMVTRKIDANFRLPGGNHFRRRI